MREKKEKLSDGTKKLMEKRRNLGDNHEKNVTQLRKINKYREMLDQTIQKK